MSYIGRGTESISNVEVLDNLTFDGSASYTLQKSSVNFVPSSANNLLISISGVVQQGNFSVSGSTITFDTTVSGSDTCDWILHYGTGLITTPADGTVSNDKIAYPLAKSGATVSTFNRTTSDGDIVELQKDGTTVGSIGSDGAGTIDFNGVSFSTLSIGGTAQCVVEDGTFRPAADNDVDLGKITGNTRRFKDLYLSGNIYLGGTTSANALDDYEEGTWTPTVLNGWGILNPTYSTNTGYYTKIGNLVYVLFKIVLSGGSTNGNPLVIDGLPYSSNSTTGGSGIYNTLHGSFSTASSNATSVFMKVGSNNTSNAQGFYRTGSGEATFTGTNAGGSFNCTFSGIYRTDS